MEVQTFDCTQTLTERERAISRNTSLDLLQKIVSGGFASIEGADSSCHISSLSVLPQPAIARMLNIPIERSRDWIAILQPNGKV